MLFAALEGYNSIRETVLGLLSNAHRLQHLGLDYVVRRSTLSEANARRTPEVFAQAYYETYKRFCASLADSCLSKTDMKRLYIMDSTTITLFKDILKGVGRNPVNGKKKGGIKAHTIIRWEDNQPCFIRYTESAKHDHLLLKDVELPQDSILCFDKGYVDSLGSLSPYGEIPTIPAEISAKTAKEIHSALDALAHSGRCH